MKRADSRTSAGLSDLDVPVAPIPRNGDALQDELVQQEFREHDARERKVARLRMLWESRRFLARVTGAGVLLSTLVAFLIPKHYQSVARLMPPDNQSTSGLAMAAAALSGGGTGMGFGGMATELLGMKSSSDLLVGVLNSRTVEDKLIVQFDLKNAYGSPKMKMEDVRKALAAWTDTTVDRKSQIITITVIDKSPQRARALAQAYIDELNHTLAEVSTSSARRERIFLEGRLKTVQQDLEAAERDFSQFASQNTTIDLKEQGKAMVEAAAALQGELIAARSELEGLRQIYADNNVRVRSVQARVAELENQLRKIDGDRGESLENFGQDDSLYPSIRKLPLLGVTYADLYRRTKVQEALFERLTQQYELSRVQEAKEIPTVKVLDPPNLPEKKTFPPRLLLMLLGTALAFWCGAAWLFARARWERTDPSDPRKVLAQEVLSTLRAAIPWNSRNGLRQAAKFEIESSKREP